MLVMIFTFQNLKDSDENITAPTTTDYSLNLKFSYIGTKTREEFNGSCLKQDKITYTHGKIVNIYIDYEVSKEYNISSYPKLEKCLFCTVSLTKTVDIDNYKFLDMVLDLIDMEFFHTLVVELPGM